MSSDARLAAIVVAAAALVANTTPARAQQPEVALMSGPSRELACAPASPLVRPTSPLTVIGGR